MTAVTTRPVPLLGGAWGQHRLTMTAALVLAFGVELAAVAALVRGTPVGPVAAIVIGLAGFSTASLISSVSSPRWQPVLQVALALILTPAVVHVAVNGGRERTMLLELAALSLALTVLAPRPALTFAAWLLVAPLFQLAARTDPMGYWANSALYLAPPILFAFWTATPRRGRKREGRLVDLFPLAYLLFALTSLIFSKYTSQTGYKSTVDQLYQYTGIGVIGYYFCAFGPVRASLPRYFAAGFLGSGFVVGSLAVIEFPTHWTLWGNDHPPGSEFRAVATLSGSGVLGAFLGAAIALSTAILLWGGPRSLRRLSVATLAVAVPGLLFTLTRGPILAALVVVPAMIAVRRSGTRWVWAGVAILTAVAIVASWGSITSTATYKNRVNERGNIEGRLLLDQWSIKLFERRPITGYGYGSFDAVKNAAQLSPGNLPLAAGRDYTSHNTFLTILVELGAVGLLLLAFPWLKISYDALRGVMSRALPDPWLVIGCAGMVGTYVLTGLSTDMRFFSIVPALTWIAVGMMRGQLLLGAAHREGAAPT